MDVAYLTIAELRRLYAKRELSPVEVTKALFARIAAHDGGLHSFLRLTEQAALAEASAAERELMSGTSRGPMHGIPYALKDIIETKGIFTTGHSKLRQDHIPAADADIVTRLKAGGELAAMAEAERDSLDAKIVELEHAIRILLLPKDLRWKTTGITSLL